LTPAVIPNTFFQVNPMQYFAYFQVVFRPWLEITDLGEMLQNFVYAVASIML
jgi:hypothetical protein